MPWASPREKNIRNMETEGSQPQTLLAAVLGWLGQLYFFSDFSSFHNVAFIKAISLSIKRRKRLCGL